MERFKTHSEAETINIGYQLGQRLQSNSVLCFFGDLGAGKTAFIKGIVSAVGKEAHTVNSPTFVYLNIYEGQPTVYHFDLYRLTNSKEFLEMGFDEFLFAGGICCIEWSERIAHLLPKDCLRIAIEHVGESQREITIA